MTTASNSADLPPALTNALIELAPFLQDGDTTAWVVSLEQGVQIAPEYWLVPGTICVFVNIASAIAAVRRITQYRPDNPFRLYAMQIFLKELSGRPRLIEQIGVAQADHVFRILLKECILRP